MKNARVWVLVMCVSVNAVTGCGVDEAETEMTGDSPESEQHTSADLAADAGAQSETSADEPEELSEAAAAQPKPPKPSPIVRPPGKPVKRSKMRKSRAAQLIRYGKVTHAQKKRKNNGWWKCTQDITDLHFAIVAATGACAAAFAEEGVNPFADVGCAAAASAVEQLTEAVIRDCDFQVRKR